MKAFKWKSDMMGFTFLRLFWPFCGDELEGARMEASKLLERSRQETVMAWTSVDGEKYTDRNILEVTLTKLTNGLDVSVDSEVSHLSN